MLPRWDGTDERTTREDSATQLLNRETLSFANIDIWKYRNMQKYRYMELYKWNEEKDSSWAGWKCEEIPPCAISHLTVGM